MARVPGVELLERRALLAVTVQISDPTIVEGDSGTTDLVFTVTRGGDPSVAFTVDYFTAGDSATAAPSGGAATFTRRTVDAAVDDPHDLFPADIDGDGDADVVTASFYGDTVAWSENDGHGNFVKHVITTGADGAVAVRAADFDGDGDMDVAASHANSDRVAWYENNGSERFTEHIIDVAADFTESLCTTDLDGDGDVDLVGASHHDDTASWYENDGDGNFAIRTITASADGVNTVFADDLDGDGDIDLLAACDFSDSILWFENDGSENFTGHVITQTANSATSVYSQDMDGDGDRDVLSSSLVDRTIAWYENDGNENFTKHVIANNLFGARSVAATDMDNDGDADILFTAESFRCLAWFENDGSANFTLRIISFTGQYPNAATTADLDADGDLDVLTNFRTEDTVAWYENSLINPVSADYAPVRGTLSFASGELAKTVTVTVYGDTAFEGDETLCLAAVIDGVAQNNRGFATILNNDQPPTKFFVVDDASANRTFEYQASGAAIENYALSSGNSAPRGAASTIAGDKVWVVDANRKVYVYNASGGLLGSWTAGTMASSAAPEGIATNGVDVWIVDAQSDKVFKYAGAASRLSGSQNAASSFSLNSANKDAKDIVTDGASLWIVNDSSTDKVFKYTVGGSLLGSWTIASANSKPTGITIDPGQVSDIWIVDSGTDRVYQYAAAAGRTSASQAAAAWFALAAGNTNPQGIADPPAAATRIFSEIASAQNKSKDLAFASLIAAPTQGRTNPRAKLAVRNLAWDITGPRRAVDAGGKTIGSIASSELRVAAGRAATNSPSDWRLELEAAWASDNLFEL